MIIDHHTKFSYERLSGSGDIVQTKSGQRDRWRDGHMDTVIPIYTPSPSQIHYKGIKKNEKKRGHVTMHTLQGTAQVVMKPFNTHIKRKPTEESTWVCC